MTPFRKSRPQRVAGAVVGVVVGALGFLPLFGGPGYEHALASGLVVPSAAAIATALELSRVDVAPLEAVGRGVVSGLALACVAFATAMLHALRVGVCDLTGGAVGFVLTAGVGAVLGGAWGAVVSELARCVRRRRLVAVSGALAGPLAGILVSLARFYGSPMIFAYDPFFGYFSGTLYDTVIDTGNSLVTYRVGSIATLAALALFGSVIERAPPRSAADGFRLRFVPLRGQPAVQARFAIGVGALLVSLGITAKGPSLGHWETSATIAEDLGGFLGGTRCDVVYPSTTSPEAAALLSKDCHEQLMADERVLGSSGSFHVTAFFFRDAADKKRLMGAADTYIAKPWRREVYLQLAPYPHPVLGHELAHVVAGSFGRGPFRVAGTFGGLWPNPGLIEGVAVAASPDDDELTDAEWAHAMLELKLLPPVADVFSIEFLGAPAAKSYTIAGAFVIWVMDTFGSETLRAWYGGSPIEGLTHQSWSSLDASFRVALSKTRLLPEVTAYARAKFEHPAVFGRRCPHVVDALRRRADGCRDSQQVAKALELYDDALRRDPHDDAALYGRGLAQLRYGDAARGRSELSTLLADPTLPRTWRDRTFDALADAELLDGRYEDAAEQYRALAASALDEDFARTEEVKALVAYDPRGRAAIEALLVGLPERPPDVVLAAARLGEWSEATSSGLSLYLLGKNIGQRGWFEESARYLDRALAAGPPPTERIGREMLRQRAISACALSDAAGVARVGRAVSDATGPYASSEGRRGAVLRLTSRCSAR